VIEYYQGLNFFGGISGSNCYHVQQFQGQTDLQKMEYEPLRCNCCAVVIIMLPQSSSVEEKTDGVPTGVQGGAVEFQMDASCSGCN
jgi:hypothetical protein